MVKKVTGRAPSLWKSVVSGLLLGVLWTVICAAVIAKLLDSQLLSMENVGSGSMVAVLSAVFAGASLAGKRAGHLILQAAVISGAAYFACLLLVNALFFGGSYTGMGVTLFLVVLATGLAVLMTGKGRGKGSRRRYKIPKG